MCSILEHDIHIYLFTYTIVHIRYRCGNWLSNRHLVNIYMWLCCLKHAVHNNTKVTANCVVNDSQSEAAEVIAKSNKNTQKSREKENKREKKNVENTKSILLEHANWLLQLAVLVCLFIFVSYCCCCCCCASWFVFTSSSNEEKMQNSFPHMKSINWKKFWHLFEHDASVDGRTNEREAIHKPNEPFKHNVKKWKYLNFKRVASFGIFKPNYEGIRINSSFRIVLFVQFFSPSLLYVYLANGDVSDKNAYILEH